MTALPRQPAAASPAIDWVPIDEAARLLDRSEGGLRRQCARLVHTGLACQRPRADGRGSCWHVAAAFDARLVRRGVERTASGASRVNELLAAAPLDKRAEAEARARVLIAFRRWRTADGVRVNADFAVFRERMTAEHGACPSRSRLYEMDAACPTSSDFVGLVAALLDGRGRPAGGVSAVSDAAWELFCGLYLDARQWSIAKCHEAVAARAAEEGWAWPGYTRVRQLIGERLTPAMIVLKREGADAWAKRHAAPMEQDPNAWAVGQCWEGDHSTLDFACKVLRGDRWVVTRPQLTAWLDRRSRRVMGWHVSEQGSAATIRLALIDALDRDETSRPDVLWIDNGKDFVAASIVGMTKAERRRRAERERDEASCSGLLGMLGIEPHFARPYNHNGKARVERWFGLVHERFDKEWESWLGSRPGMIDRRERRAQTTDTDLLPTLDEIRGAIAGFIEWYNHRADHRIDDLVDRDAGERLSPEEFYRRFLPARQLVDRDALKLLGQVWSLKPIKVHKWGVSIEVGGRRVRYGELEPALEELVGTSRRVYVSVDPGDTGRVQVWDEDFTFRCTALENGRYGGLANDQVTVADRKRAYAARREQRRRLETRLDLTTASLSDPELVSKMARDREVAQTKDRLRREDRSRRPEEMPSLRLVRTPVDGQAAAVERESMRQAVGAEFEEEPGFDLADLRVVGEPDDEPEFDLEFDVAPDATPDEGDDGPFALEFTPTTDGEETPDVLDLIGRPDEA